MKKIALSKETLRTLDSRILTEVKGGVDTKDKTATTILTALTSCYPTKC